MPEAPRHNPMMRALDFYWEQSRRPLASLVFIVPLLVVYEAGVLFFGPERVRNGADAWLRQLLDLMGFGQYFLLPVLTVFILLGWHYVTRQPWRLSRGLIWGMAVECVALSICLRLLLQVLSYVFPHIAAVVTADVSGVAYTMAADAAGFLGAGIYEELLFRLILLSLVAWALRRTGLKPAAALTLAVLATCVLFALAHYVPPGGYAFHWGDPTSWFSLAFRLLAGVFFSLLFWYRGFGIAAGAHAGYDILAGLFPQL